ncbi:unnamed protein product, partial [Porites lobata]
FRRLFGARQLTARVSLANVVMSSTAGANTVPLEPNVVIANEVHDAAEADDTDHVEFDLDELKEQLGIDSILEKLNDLAAKFCGDKSRTEYSGSEAQNSKSSSETTEGVFDPSVARSGRKSTFLGYRGRGSYFHDRQQGGGRSVPITSTKTQKDKV